MTSKTTLFALTIGLTMGLSACSTASAHSAHNESGYWKLNPYKCPDLVEDWRDRRESRIDEAYDRGPRDVAEDIRDRRESRRDEAHTWCPASAWEWYGPAYKTHFHAPRPKYAKIYYNSHKKHYYRKHGHKHVKVRW